MINRLRMPGRHKYGARRTFVPELNLHFASAAEAKRARELVILQQRGDISGLQFQPRYPIVVAGRPICTYVGDFAYLERGALVVEDVKGWATREYQIKKKLMLACHGIAVREVK